MSDTPKFTNPNVVWINTSWNVRTEVMKSVAEYVNSVNEMLETVVAGQKVTLDQAQRFKKAAVVLVTFVKAIPDDIEVPGRPPRT